MQNALHAAFGFRDFYLADLDAIGGQPPSWELFAQFLARGFRIAVDAGIREELDGRRLLEAGVDCIVGLETLAGPDTLPALLDLPNKDRLIFSLDLKQGEPLGNLDCWRATDAWSIAEQVLELGVQRLIVLDLARVGVGEGVGTEELCRRIKRSASAGGVDRGRRREGHRRFAAARRLRRRPGAGCVSSA